MDVQQAKDPAVMVVELFVPMVTLATMIKSVRIPYCHSCNGPLWALRFKCALLFVAIWFAMYCFIFCIRSKITVDDAYVYFFSLGFLGVLPVPFRYVTLKERLIGIKVSRQNGLYYYRFRSTQALLFLERMKKCSKSNLHENMWMAIDMMPKSKPPVITK